MGYSLPNRKCSVSINTVTIPILLRQIRLSGRFSEKMKFCYECGTKLVPKELEGEGIVPFCESCGVYRFPIFSTAVSMIVLNRDKTKILLIQQYGTGNNVLVAGYVNKGENAESAVLREISEELGLEAEETGYCKSEYFPKTNTLMLNYRCIVNSEHLDKINRKEIDKAEWFPLERAREAIMPDSLAKYFLCNFLDNLL